MEPTQTSPLASAVPVPPPATEFPLILKISLMAYGVVAIFIILGNNIPGLIGDLVRMMSIPMLLLGVVLGLSMFGFGVSIAFKKTNTLIVRILSPLIGIVFGLVVFAGSGFLSFMASLSNAHESGGS